MSGNNNTDYGILSLFHSIYENVVLPNSILFGIVIGYMIYRFLLLPFFFAIDFKKIKNRDLWIFAKLDMLEKKYPNVIFLQNWIKAYRLKYPMKKGRLALAEFNLKKKYTKKIRLKKIKQKVYRSRNKIRLLTVHVHKYRSL